MPDRIEAGTFLIAGAILGGEITVEEVIPEHLSAVTTALEKAGVTVDIKSRSISIRSNKSLQPVDITATEYPGFPTDLQPQWCVLAALSSGTSTIKDTVFSSRFDHMDELKKMGAKFKRLSDGVQIQGGNPLSGAELYAKNLRHAAALVLSGYVAKGKTNILRISELNRGYPDFFLKINNILCG